MFLWTSHVPHTNTHTYIAQSRLDVSREKKREILEEELWCEAVVDGGVKKRRRREKRR